MAELDVITENLAELLTNTVNMTSVYYDIFINPEPMDVTLEQFNKDNTLVKVTIPNRAKDRSIAVTGVGSPQGAVARPVGTAYVDTASNTVYFKAQGDGVEGWVEVLSQEGVQSYVRTYLANNDFLTKSGLETYLGNNGYINQAGLSKALSTFSPVIYMNEITPAEGYIVLKDDSGYYLTATGDITFVLPNVTDLTRLHSMTIQLSMPEVVNINLGTDKYFDRIVPTFNEAGMYNIIYEYDNASNCWVVGVMIKGA